MLARYWFLLYLDRSEFLFGKISHTRLIGDKLVEFLLYVGHKFKDRVTIAHMFESAESRDRFFKRVEGFGHHVYAVVIYVNKPKNVIGASPFSSEAKFKKFYNELSKVVDANIHERLSKYVV